MDYELKPKNPYVEAIRSMAEFEIRPSHTVTFLSEVDLTDVEEVRRSMGNNRPSYTTFVVKAVAAALKEFPFANQRLCRRAWLPWLSPRLQRFKQIDISVAAERDIPEAEGMTFVDVIRDADQKSVQEVNDWLRNLATADLQTNQQWRTFTRVIEKLPTWLSKYIIRLPYFFPSLWTKYRGGAVLISSPSKYGVDALVATWTAPLGVSFGLVKERAVVRQGRVVPCKTFMLTLNFDRRIMAGAPAARFFNRIVKLLENASTELSEYISPAQPVQAAAAQTASAEKAPAQLKVAS